MRQHYHFTPIKTKDIKAIMRVLYNSNTLSRIAYCRLHNYIVTLERMAIVDIRDRTGAHLHELTNEVVINRN